MDCMYNNRCETAYLLNKLLKKEAAIHLPKTEENSYVEKLVRILNM